MCPEDVHPLRDRLFANAEEGQHLVHVHSVDLVACSQPLSFCQYVFNIAVTCFSCHTYAQFHTFPLCFSRIKALLVSLIDLIQFRELGFIVSCPDIFTCHFSSTFLFYLLLSDCIYRSMFYIISSISERGNISHGNIPPLPSSLYTAVHT